MKELRKLQVELCHLQEWVKAKGLRVIIIFEGRDAAGKGGTIKALTERVSPRIFRVVALPAPSDREKGQLYMQRYIAAFSDQGRDRNIRPQLVQPRRRRVRAGLLYPGTTRSASLQTFPSSRSYIVAGGVQLIKIWLESSDKEQKRRFEARIDDPLRQWKLSPMDLFSRTRWFDYSRARDLMLKASDTEEAPWYILRSDDKKRARLNGLAHILSLIPYKKVKREKVKMPKRSMKHAYDDQKSIEKRKFVKEAY